MEKYLNKLIGILAMAALMAACKGTAKLPERAPAPIKEQALREELKAGQNVYKSLRIRANGSFEQGGSSQSFRLEVRLLKDSLVWIDVADPILGIKVARALVTPDSVAFVNRLSSEYFTGEVGKLQKELGLEFGFSELQKILSAQLIFSLTEEFKLYYRPGLYLLSDFDADDVQAAAKTFGKEKFRQVFIDPTTMRPSLQVQNEPVNGKRYSVKYEELGRNEETTLIYPARIEVEYLADEPAKLTLDIRSIEKNDPQLNYPFNIPSGYAKMR